MVLGTFVNSSCDIKINIKIVKITVKLGSERVKQPLTVHCKNSVATF